MKKLSMGGCVGFELYCSKKLLGRLALSCCAHLFCPLVSMECVGDDYRGFVVWVLSGKIRNFMIKLYIHVVLSVLWRLLMRLKLSCSQAVEEVVA